MVMRDYYFDEWIFRYFFRKSFSHTHFGHQFGRWHCPRVCFVRDIFNSIPLQSSASCNSSSLHGGRKIRVKLRSRNTDIDSFSVLGEVIRTKALFWHRTIPESLSWISTLSRAWHNASNKATSRILKTLHFFWDQRLDSNNLHTLALRFGITIRWCK